MWSLFKFDASVDGTGWCPIVWERVHGSAIPLPLDAALEIAAGYTRDTGFVALWVRW